MKYTNNEAYFDVVEEVDAIIDRTGATVFAEIQGYVCLRCKYLSCTVINTSCTLIICTCLFQIDCCIKLSGMPDLTLSFMNPRLFDDVSFHPCVRFKRWEVGIKIYMLSNFCVKQIFELVRLYFSLKGYFLSSHRMVTSVFSRII